MEAVIRDDSMVEVRSNNGEVFIIDRSDYELAQGLLDLARKTSPSILRSAVEHWAADSDEEKESRFLANFFGMYLEHRQQ